MSKFQDELLKVINGKPFEYMFYPDKDYICKYKWLKFVNYYKQINLLNHFDYNLKIYCFMLLDKMAEEQDLKELRPSDLIKIFSTSDKQNLSGLLTDWLDYSHVEAAITFYEKGINFATSPMPPSSYEFVFSNHVIDSLEDFHIFSKCSLELYDRVAGKSVQNRLTEKQLKLIDTMLKIIDFKWLIKVN